MTSETRTTIEPWDIKSIELECTQCGFRVVWPLHEWRSGYVKCSHCGASWPLQQNAAYEALDRMVSSLSKLAKVDPDAIPLRIRFELIEPIEKKEP